jgi:thiol-disulfide isomerase/thioredoxin
MNRNLLISFLVALAIAGCKNNNIEINGKLTNFNSGDFIYLDELKATDLVTVDSARLSADGSFKLSRNINSPSFYLIKTDESNFLTMLLEPGQVINIHAYRDSLNYPTMITGSKGTSLMDDYNKTLRKSIEKLGMLSEIYQQNIDSPDLTKVMERLDSTAQVYLTEINSYTKNYIDNNLTSLVSLVAVYQQIAPGEYILNPEKDLPYFVKVDSSLSLLYPDYEPVKSLHEQVLELEATISEQGPASPVSADSSEAPEILLPDPQGDTISLSSTRGNVVLLDFWASWCSPCRMENPNLVKAYDLYHQKGFEIYQVSLDKTKDAWIKGIEDDQLEKWIHVSDVKYWNSIVVPLYKIESIPTNFLLDKDGRIIASNLRGEMLVNKLAEIFDK